MVRCEHFIYGHGIGIVKSPNINLSSTSLKALRSLRESSETLLPEGYIAISFVDDGQDEYGRNTLRNETFIVTVQDYFKLTDVQKLFEKHRLKDWQHPPQTLESLRVGTK